MNIWERYDPRSSNYMYAGYDPTYAGMESSIQKYGTNAGNKLWQDWLHNQSLSTPLSKPIQPKQPEGNYFTKFWDSFTDETLKNPMNTLGGIGSIWNMYQDFKNMKAYNSLQRDAYNTQKELAMQSNQRAQEAFDMSKANRAGHQL